MTYEDFASGTVRVLEGAGGAIMVVGGLVAFGCYVRDTIAREQEPYRRLRANLGRAILLAWRC
jgi:uncharacterized membrane protein